MQLKGSYLLSASIDKIWSILMDADTLGRITPGVTRLEAISEDRFKAIADVKLGPVKGTFSGDLELVDKKPPESFSLHIKQNSKIGNVTAQVLIELSAISEAETQINFDGKAQLSGLLARTGQRVLSGVSNTLSNQFFAALEQELEKPDSTTA